MGMQIALCCRGVRVKTRSAWSKPGSCLFVCAQTRQYWRTLRSEKLEQKKSVLAEWAKMAVEAAIKNPVPPEQYWRVVGDQKGLGGLDGFGPQLVSHTDPDASAASQDEESPECDEC